MSGSRNAILVEGKLRQMAAVKTVIAWMMPIALELGIAAFCPCGKEVCCCVHDALKC